MHHSLFLVTSLLVVVWFVLPAVPAEAQTGAALIENNEAAAIADLMTIISAETAYQVVNAGFYDTPACLLGPSGCIPGYPAEAPFFLDEAVASLMVKDGYGRAFFTKPPAQEPGEDAPPTRAEFYAVTMWPDKRGKTGRRGFCGDADGIICFTNDGSAPRITPDGRCPWEEREGKPAGCEVLH